MDREALRSVENNAGIPDYIKSLDDGVTALLIDLEEESQEALDQLIARTKKASSGFELERDFEVTSDLKEITDYWNVRKGVFPSVGGMRKPGTSVIIEDVAVSAEHLTSAVMDMRQMLDELGYNDAVIYGHVLDGNLHFIFAQDFHKQEELKKYEDMIFRLSRLIVGKYDGSLKAEHGTGINMAPFVAYEWGETIYKHMREIKKAFDPTGILNPGVIISDDAEIHLRSFKPMPVIDEAVVDKISLFKKIWIWDRHLPRPVKKKTLARLHKAEDTAIDSMKVVYFPSCISQSMGPAVKESERRSLIEVSTEVLEKAGYTVIYPEKMNTLCCGTPWESKGFFDIADAKSSELEKALLKASKDGKYPVLCDTSPCTDRMLRVMTDRLKLYEPVEFIHDHLLDKLELKKTEEALAFHITCTSTKMGLQDKFIAVAKACTENPIFPEEVGCCGFAGDKGFTHPEINTWALRNLKLQVNSLSAGYSNSRTCEIGLSRNSGIDYRSIMYLVSDAIKS